MTAPDHAFGPYKVISEVSMGGFCKVYRCEHAETGNQVAVKTILFTQEAYISGIRREIRALAALDHPDIVKVLDDGVLEGAPWYAMELISGATLLDYCQGPAHQTTLTLTASGPRSDEHLNDTTRFISSSEHARPDSRPTLTCNRPSLETILNLMNRICGALAYIHGEGVVHRDLKPQNILVRPSGTPVLIDFGLALRGAGGSNREALEHTEGVSGTLYYMSPEQIHGELLDPRADIYALGCVFYQLLTGRPPFLGTSSEVVRQHELAFPVLPSQWFAGLPAEIDELVLRMMAKRKEDRIGYAEDVAAALRQFRVSQEGSGEASRAYLYRPALAGRNEHLATLEASLSLLRCGIGGLALVGGESGVGKTRLMLELTQRAEGEELRIITAESQFASTDRDGNRVGAVPLGMFRPFLQSLADWCYQAGANETQHLIGLKQRVLSLYEPSLAGLPGIPGLPEPADLPPSEAKLRLFTYMTGTLMAWARSRPLLLMMDDLQWADDLSLELLIHLQSAGLLEEFPVLIVATHRTEEVTGLLHELVNAPELKKIRLERLDEAALEQAVGSMLSLFPPPVSISRFLMKHSEGNPFFASEYLRMAVEEGVLRRDSRGRWQLGDLTDDQLETHYGKSPIPDSLRALLSRRLDGLSGDAQVLVRAAAVFGRELTPNLLEQLGGFATTRTLDALNELLRRGIFEETAAGRLRFVHDKIREIAYGAIPEESRVESHRATAEAIEQLPHDEREELLAPLASHWERAGAPERARVCYLAGARRAISQYAHDEAERLYRCALSLAGDHMLDRLTARTELARGVLALRGRNDEALEAYRLSLEEARSIGAWGAEGDCLLGIADIRLRQGKREESEQACVEAIALYQKAGDLLKEGQALHRLAFVHLDKGDLDEGRLRLEQALAHYSDLGNDADSANVLHNLGAIAFRLGSVDEAEELWQRSHALQVRIGNRRGEAMPLCNLAWGAMRRGKVERGLKQLEEALKIQQETGDLRQEPLTLFTLIRDCYEYDGPRRSLAQFNRVQLLRRQTTEQRTIAVLEGCLALIRAHQGKLKEAENHATKALELVRASGLRALEVPLLSILAGILAEMGQAPEALTLYREAFALLRKYPAREEEARVLLELAILERRRQVDPMEAQARLEEAMSIYRSLGDRVHMALSRCEEGHQAIAAGLPGREKLRAAQDLLKDARMPGEGRLIVALTRLQRAVLAQETKREKLVAGECM